MNRFHYVLYKNELKKNKRPYLLQVERDENNWIFRHGFTDKKVYDPTTWYFNRFEYLLPKIQEVMEDLRIRDLDIKNLTEIYKDTHEDTKVIGRIMDSTMGEMISDLIEEVGRLKKHIAAKEKEGDKDDNWR